MRPALLVALALLTAGCLVEKGYGKKNPDFLVVGHRGAPNDAPENTIPSLELAAVLGANAVEIDVCVTADDRIVIWHDRDPDDDIAVARQRGAENLGWVPVVPADSSPDHRPVEQLTLERLRATHGYAAWPGFGDREAGVVIPIAEDLLDWAARTPEVRRIYVDVKVAATDTARADLVFRELHRLHAASRARTELFFISPYRPIVEALIASREALGASEHLIAWDFEGAGSLAGARSLSLRHVSTGLTPTRYEDDFMDEIQALVDARHDGDIDSITAWTVDKRIQMALLLYLGADAVLTNDPAELHDVWQKTLH